MKALIQRVDSSSVTVNNKTVGSISYGMLVLLGIEKDDTVDNLEKMIQKIINFRMFSDADDKMNLSINAINGEILLVSQFTLAADTNAGKRPSFSSAMEPKRAKEMYDLFVEKLKKEVNKVETGKFGADSKVSLVNDGPVTFMLSC